MKKVKVIWSKQAQLAVKSIFDYYKLRSLQSAKKLRNELLQSPKKIQFSKQYQVDEINPKYRRIVVRDYKVLYQEKNHVIQILDVISTRQSPNILRSK